MAYCYVLFPIGSGSVATGRQVVSSSAAPFTSYWEGSRNFTVPNGYTVTAASIYFVTEQDTLSAEHLSVSVAHRGRVTWTGYDSDYQTSVPFSINTPSGGTALTFYYNLATSISNIDSTASYRAYEVQYSYTAWLCFKLEIPALETTITASTLNKFAKIFNTSTVSAGDNITRSPWQAIGTAIGTMKTTWNGSTNATAVTFDSTKPLSSNLQSVITNMTDKFLIYSS